MTTLLETPASGTADWPTTVHGTDPVTGHPGKWHVERDGSAGMVRVQWAFGHLTNPAVWMQASKVTSVVTEAYARTLLARVSR
jgi:hypothetical protein